jgi:hypothetical protein
MSAVDAGHRDGPLRNGNRRGDPNLAPRCAARTRTGKPCRSPAMENGRCRMHGGASTGPRTAAGRERSRAANLVHGYRTIEALEEKKFARQIIWASTAMLTLVRKPRRRTDKKRKEEAATRAAASGHPKTEGTND